MWILFLGFICLLLVIGAFTGRPVIFAVWSLIILAALGFIIFAVYVAIQLSKPTNTVSNTTATNNPSFNAASKLDCPPNSNGSVPIEGCKCPVGDTCSGGFDIYAAPILFDNNGQLCHRGSIKQPDGSCPCPDGTSFVTGSGCMWNKP
jgi:hypothetical protein